MRETERGNEKQLIFFYGKLAKFSITSGYVEQEKERERGKGKTINFLLWKTSEIFNNIWLCKRGKRQRERGNGKRNSSRNFNFN